jgi:hypothetical protein
VIWAARFDIFSAAPGLVIIKQTPRPSEPRSVSATRERIRFFISSISPDLPGRKKHLLLFLIPDPGEFLWLLYSGNLENVNGVFTPRKTPHETGR